MKAIVIGAGLAGLACARELDRAGAEVVVLEARERAGGRVWSTTMPNGVVVERGGEFLMSDYELVPALARELGLRLVDHGFVYADRRPVEAEPGVRERIADASARLADRGARWRAEGGRGSIAGTIASADLSDDERRLIRARLTISLASELDVVSANWPPPQSGVNGHSEFGITRKILGGNQQLAERMAAELTTPVRFRAVAVAVERSADSVAVHTADGGRERGDAVVVTAPAPLVRRLRFEPDLPAATADAYARVPMGVVSKLHVELAERADPEAVQETATPFWAYAAAEQDGRASVVASAIGGHAAHADLGVAAGPAEWRARLKRAWPQLELSETTLLTSWGADPWSCGAYTHRPLDWSDEAEEALRAPVGRILFAGEHAGPEQSIEGVIRSGRRAAEEALGL